MSKDRGIGGLEGKMNFRQIRYDEKRLDILKNAAKMFARNGYENVKMEDLAARLKLNKATLYYYFKSKDEIFFMIQMQAIEQANEALEKVLNSRKGPKEKLRAAIKSHVNIVTRDYITGTFRQRELVLPKKYMTQLITARDRFEGNFQTIILEGLEKGVFQKGYWRLTVLSILGMLNSIPKWYSSRGDFTPEEIGKVLSDFMIKGLSIDE